jgi:hypothetical protein
MSELKGLTEITALVLVKVANGALITCQFQLLNQQWFIYGYSFTSIVHLLPLTTYDLVVGMDLLERFSPMKVDWVAKWMAIPYNGTTVVL